MTVDVIMAVDPRQIAKMITEDPDEINPLDNIEDEYEEKQDDIDDHEWCEHHNCHVDDCYGYHRRWEDDYGEDDYGNDVLAVFASLKLVPVGTDPETLRFIDNNGNDHTDEMFDKLGSKLDGFEVIKAGNPANIIAFPSDWCHNSGGHVVVFSGHEWTKQDVKPIDLPELRNKLAGSAV